MYMYECMNASIQDNHTEKCIPCILFAFL